MSIPEPAVPSPLPDEPEPPAILERYGLHLALLAAWIATVGSLYFSEQMHFVPCRLCWFQRIFMYPLAVILPIGILRRDRGVTLYVLPLTLIGAAIALYHRLVQAGVLDESAACQVAVPCSGRYINWLGFITIPTLALTAFLIIALGASAVFRAWRSGRLRDADPAAPRPWRPVLAIVGGVCLAFALLAWWQGA